MADTADRRKEGKPNRYTNQKALRKYWESVGLCKVCGKVEVVNRKTCYTCVDRQMLHTMRYFVRKAAKLGFVQILRDI